MKVTKTLIRYAWLYNFSSNENNAFNCFFGENTFIGKFGLALVFIGSFMLMSAVGVGYCYEMKSRYAGGTIVLALGALFCLINAIKRMRVGRKKTIKMIEEATFEIKD